VKANEPGFANYQDTYTDLAVKIINAKTREIKVVPQTENVYAPFKGYSS